MSSLATTAWAFLAIVGATALGVLLRRGVVAHHLDADSRDVLKLVLGIIATMSALVLSLLIASAGPQRRRALTNANSLSRDVNRPR